MPPVQTPASAPPARRRRFPAPHPLWFAAGLLAASDGATAQSPGGALPPAATNLPVRLDLSRRDLKNFLTDKDALAPYRNAKGTASELRDVFALGAVDSRFAALWDPLACRLVGVLDLKAPPETGAPPPPPSANSEEKDGEAPQEPTPPDTPYLYKAAGPFPLAKTPGASGPPRYFGFRLVNGAPEFLYTCGGVSIEERLWLEDGGKILQQRFSAKQASRGLQIAIPEGWKGRVAASAGTWRGSVLAVPAESSGDVVLSHALAPAGPASPETKPQ